MSVKIFNKLNSCSYQYLQKFASGRCRKAIFIFILVIINFPEKFVLFLFENVEGIMTDTLVTEPLGCSNGASFTETQVIFRVYLMPITYLFGICGNLCNIYVFSHKQVMSHFCSLKTCCEK